MYEGAVTSGNGITNMGDKAVAITDTTVSDASALNTLNGYTTGVVTASTVQALTGTAIVLNTLLTAGNDTNQFSSDSFASLATATLSDSTLSVTHLTELLVPQILQLAQQVLSSL